MNKKSHIEYETKSALFKALGHPVRLRMVVELSRGLGCNVNDIAENLGLPQSTVSQHLGILRSHGIVSPEKDGVNTCYKVVDKLVLDLIERMDNN